MLAGGLYERTSGAAGQPLAGYRRREPERTVLHELVAQHAQTMLAEMRAADPEGGGLPRYVERELTEYLRCARPIHPARRRRAEPKRGGRVPWAELLRRVFAADVLACPCGGRRRVVAVVVDSALARTLLAALGLPCTPATFAPARAPPQAELWFDDAS